MNPSPTKKPLKNSGIMLVQLPKRNNPLKNKPIEIYLLYFFISETPFRYSTYLFNLNDPAVNNTNPISRIINIFGKSC